MLVDRQTFVGSWGVNCVGNWLEDSLLIVRGGVNSWVRVTHEINKYNEN